jgi:hypothetical protein
MMNQSEHINELASALSKAQGEMEAAIKDSSNPFFKSKYADLNSIWSACRLPLSKNGLAVIQTIDQNESGQLVLITLLCHCSGQWIRSRAPIITQKHDPQSIGSAITYFKRYSLSAIVGVSTDEDDDGEGAMNRCLKDKYPTPQNPPQKGPLKTQYEKKEEFCPVIKEDWVDFKELLKKCSEDHQTNVWNYLESQKIFCENDIDYALLEKLRKGAYKNIDKIKES